VTIRSSRLPFAGILASGLGAGAIFGFLGVRSAFAGHWLPMVLAVLLVAGEIVGLKILWAVTTLTVDSTTVRLRPPHRAPIAVPRHQIYALVRPMVGKAIPLDIRDAQGNLLIRIQSSFAKQDLERFARYLGMTIEAA
jgi:hypothetical protein